MTFKRNYQLFLMLHLLRLLYYKTGDPREKLRWRDLLKSVAKNWARSMAFLCLYNFVAKFSTCYLKGILGMNGRGQ